MADVSVTAVHRVPQLPARMLWVAAALMTVDVIYFRHLEAADPGRTFRHGCGALALVALGLLLSRGIRNAYWVALAWSVIMAIVSWSGVALILLWDRMPFGERASTLGIACGAAVWTMTVISLLLRDTRAGFLLRGRRVEGAVQQRDEA